MKLLCKKLFYFFPLLLCIIIINYIVDPTKFFHFKSEKQMAQALLHNTNVVPLSVFNDRMLQYHYIRGLREKKDIIVLGSSHTMLIGSESFPKQSFFNSSVSGASIEDLITIYSLYKNEHLIPKTIIIGIDPWLFNKNNELTSWLTLAQTYESGFLEKDIHWISKIKIFTQIVFQTINRLISPLYFRESLRYICCTSHTIGFTTAKNRFSNQGKVILTDGSIEYEQYIRLRTPKDIEKEAKKHINSDTLYSLNNFYELNPELLYKFQRFIEELKKEKSNIIFFLSPYHPILYDYIIQDPKYAIVQKVQQHITWYAKINGITIIGSYNPSDILLKNEDFYDEMHVQKEAVKKLFMNINLLPSK